MGNGCSAYRKYRNASFVCCKNCHTEEEALITVEYHGEEFAVCCNYINATFLDEI